MNLKCDLLVSRFAFKVIMCRSSVSTAFNLHSPPTMVCVCSATSQQSKRMGPTLVENSRDSTLTMPASSAAAARGRGDVVEDEGGNGSQVRKKKSSMPKKKGKIVFCQKKDE
jgi:hypothetical protein